MLGATALIHSPDAVTHSPAEMVAYNQPLPTRDAGVEKVPLQHGVVMRSYPLHRAGARRQRAGQHMPGADRAADRGPPRNTYQVFARGSRAIVAERSLRGRDRTWASVALASLAKCSRASKTSRSTVRSPSSALRPAGAFWLGWTSRPRAARDGKGSSRRCARRRA